MDADGCVQIRRFLQNLPRFRQRDHSPGIPGKQNLIVLVELCTIYTVLIKLFQPGIIYIPTILRSMNPVGNALSFKIAGIGNVIQAAEFFAVFFPQSCLDFLRGEHIVFPFHTVAVRVLTAIAAAFLIGQLPQNIPSGSIGSICKGFLLGMLIGFCIGNQQKGVVIEHLLKVRNQPHFIRGIPGEATADMVKDAAFCHVLQRDLRHFHSVGFLQGIGVPHKKQQIVGRREFWCCPKAAPLVVKPLGKLSVCPFHQPAVRLRAIACLSLIDRRGNLISRPQQLLPVVLPEVSYPIKQIHQAKSSIAAKLGKIGSGKEWLLLRGHEDRQGPAAGAGHGLTHGHIHRVDIRALLPVHLDADELPVEQVSHLPVLKGFMGHHMTPVAGGIPDT